MIQMTWLISAAFMVVTGIYLGQQGLTMRRANKILAGVVASLQANPPIASFEAMASAGDRIAHELLWEQNAEILGRWWELRGGHDRCTVCRPISETGAEQ